ncbi:Pkinase-domain-containing protein [Backusella circina FSU 941]|nr:Pkinase-domain-containing protein [Backusella circina FSU 941]
MERDRPNTFDAKSLLYTMIDNQTIQLVSVLGVGGNGVVYLGQNIFTGQLFAVKLLIHLRSAYKEVNIHAYLSGHPNIVRFEKVVQENNRTYMIVEYAPGGDLFAAITQSGRGIVGNNDAIRHIFLQIIDAIEYCHQNGVAHCDLKPENILLSHNWQVKLADFGLASTKKISTEFGCGSEYYFSPGK